MLISERTSSEIHGSAPRLACCNPPNPLYSRLVPTLQFEERPSTSTLSLWQQTDPRLVTFAGGCFFNFNFELRLRLRLPKFSLSTYNFQPRLLLSTSPPFACTIFPDRHQHLDTIGPTCYSSYSMYQYRLASRIFASSLSHILHHCRQPKPHPALETPFVLDTGELLQYMLFFPATTTSHARVV